MGEAVVSLKSKEVLQRDINRLEKKGTFTRHMKFNKSKC